MWQQIKESLTTWRSKQPLPQETPWPTEAVEKKPKKPWSELTEEERAEIRESWKHTLPDEYDVFCIGVFSPKIHSMSELLIPGRFYACGNVMCKHPLSVDEDFIINGNVKCLDLNVGGKLYIGGDAKTDDMILSSEAVICGYTTCGNIDTLADFNTYGDVNCGNLKSESSVTIEGSLDSLRVDIQNGSLNVHGDACASNEVNVSGCINIAGDADFEDVNSGSDITIEGNAKCGDVFANGDITFNGDADCFDVEAGGRIKVAGKAHFESVKSNSLDI